MWLQCIQPVHLGPFQPIPDEIEDANKLYFERDVTVLTGGNDVGKSYALRLIELVCAGRLERVLVPEDDINLLRCYKTGAAPASAEEAGWSAWFKLEDDSSAHFKGQPWHGAGTLTVQRHVSRPVKMTVIPADGPGRANVNLDLPSVKRIEIPDAIPGQVGFRDGNAFDQALLRVAFGPAFSASVLDGRAASARLREASKTLNARLEEVLPPTLSFTLELDGNDRSSGMLNLHVEDGLGALTPLELRGAGVRRLLALAVLLADVDFGDRYGIVLLDEPETGLHADAQRAVRFLLERYAQQAKRQVVYATHSPCMINPWRPETVRLLYRARHRDKVTTLIHRWAAHENWLPVRDALGMQLDDSLLWSAVVVCVEGKTEFVCLRPLLRKLEEARAPGFDAVGELLEHVTVVDVEGDKYDVVCRLIRQFGVKPVLFLDGDKRQPAKLQSLHDSVPRVQLPEGKTFEDLVPQKYYLQAVAALICESGATTLAASDFENWEKEKEDVANRGFVRRAKAWLKDRTDRDLDKPETMRKAIEICPAEEVESATLRELVTKVRTAMGQNTTTLVSG
ncbi:MAG: AAA family ATPase [Armatimonadetes bacterium]|nr:AAA family ATPase [Armatimonadota bacterium]